MKFILPQPGAVNKPPTEKSNLQWIQTSGEKGVQKKIEEKPLQRDSYKHSKTSGEKEMWKKMEDKTK